MTHGLPFLMSESTLPAASSGALSRFTGASPFPHAVIDEALPADHINFLHDNFPSVDHPVWLNWRQRSPSQYGKQGVGNADKFELLDPIFRLALQEFNSSIFLAFLERLTGIGGLIPDPYFTGGGIHQIVNDGFLDIHTDFNSYSRLGLYRQLNVLLYLNRDWREEYGGQLELSDSGGHDFVCQKSIEPLFNRMVVFHTTKQSFHGHPQPWRDPAGSTRKSIALYYYTSYRLDDQEYNENTDFQGIVSRDLQS